MKVFLLNNFPFIKGLMRMLSGFFLIVNASVSYAQTYTWGNVAMGGGGMITGIITSKTQQNLLYARTDVGGAYRWDNTNTKWVPLLDWCSDNETTYMGVEALALDPQNSAKVYMLAGTSYWNGGKTAILSSSDYGSTFTITDVSAKFTADGNATGRGAGERLAVDPNNSNILLCGTRSKGLWKSTDAGATWNLLWNGVTTTTNGNGICFVVFDGSSVSGGVTQRIFVGVSRSGTNNLYMSTNGGTSFSAITSSATTLMPIRAALASNGNLYISYSNAEGPYNASTGGTGKIYKYNITGATMTDVSPSASFGYAGISVDPNNSSRLIASSYGYFWTQYTSGGSTAYGDRFFLSTNGGTSWTDLVTKGTGMTLNNNGMPWINTNVAQAIHYSSCIEFDPYNSAQAWVSSGNGLFFCSNVDATQTAWLFDVKGIEETVPLDFVSISGGPVGTAVGDFDGCINPTVTTYAAAHNPEIGTNTGIAYAPASTSKMVRVGNTASNIYYSTNQGSTWTACAANKGSGGKVAICADGSTILHCPNGSNTTYYSTNNGSAWTSTGVTNVTNAVPVADYVNTNYVYIYNSGTGQMLVSSNKGVSFSASGSPGSGGSKLIRTVPGNEGHIWVALYGNGLKYSTDHGATYTTVSGVTNCYAVGIGKTATSSTYPSVYIWGTVGGVVGAYRSIDQGTSWIRINDDAHEFGGVANSNGQFVMGDPNVYGRVYLSTVGRGVVYGDPGVTTPVTLLSFDGSFDGDDLVKLTWKTTAEINMNGYKLFRTAEPAVEDAWKEIGSVASANAANDIQTYSYFDFNVSSASTLYYKLVSVESNGSEGISKVIAVTREGEETRMEVYPNPSGDFFTLTIKDPRESSHVVQIYDIVGKAIEEINLPSGISKVSIGQNFLPGIYFVSLKGTQQKMIKLIKQ